ncbi:jg1324, partial [Pararge aegeria aegeria]
MLIKSAFLRYLKTLKFICQKVTLDFPQSLSRVCYSLYVRIPNISPVSGPQQAAARAAGKALRGIDLSHTRERQLVRAERIRPTLYLYISFPLTIGAGFLAQRLYEKGPRIDSQRREEGDEKPKAAESQDDGYETSNSGEARRKPSSA